LCEVIMVFIICLLFLLSPITLAALFKDEDK
jgi:hypothetical protein